MRQIGVSTEVYAAIWSARQSGEDNENDILRRVLKVAPSETPATIRTAPTQIGFSDPRFGINLREGFEIFRTYLGAEYRARATGGQWLLLNTGDTYPSLNQLSKAVGTKTENAWNNWYFIDQDGKRKLIAALRP